MAPLTPLTPHLSSLSSWDGPSSSFWSRISAWTGTQKHGHQGAPYSKLCMDDTRRLLVSCAQLLQRQSHDTGCGPIQDEPNPNQRAAETNQLLQRSGVPSKTSWFHCAGSAPRFGGGATAAAASVAKEFVLPGNRGEDTVGVCDDID